jgi:hypothetical protein
MTQAVPQERSQEVLEAEGGSEHRGRPAARFDPWPVNPSLHNVCPRGLAPRACRSELDAVLEGLTRRSRARILDAWREWCSPQMSIRPFGEPARPRLISATFAVQPPICVSPLSRSR